MKKLTQTGIIAVNLCISNSNFSMKVSGVTMIQSGSLLWLDLFENVVTVLDVFSVHALL